ncbi:MAG: ABC transporter ATP-binding protein [Gammaproteobacteria bacterium]|nr:ABC transporter ATP-binding protein [Gammaproteobacteria bacterium]
MGLEFHDVSHRFDGELVLRNVSLVASAGEITCLLGPSGSGKSTLLRLAAGLERLQSGSMRIDGELLCEPGHDPPPENRPIGLVFQEHVLFPHLTVRQNVAFGLDRLASTQRRRIANECMASVGLTPFAERFPDTLSGGQQQRVALARALAPEPRAILLDEPFANVDPTLRRSLREDARRALRSAGGITLLVTHDPEEALDLADRIAVLDRGCIVQTGTPTEVWRSPASRTVAEMFGSAQHLRGTATEGVVTTAFGTVSEHAERSGDVDVIVRPAAVSLRKASSGPRVVDIRFLGDRFSVLVESDGETLRASTSDLDGLDVGDCVAVTFLGMGDTAPASLASSAKQASEHFQRPSIFVYNRE